MLSQRMRDVLNAVADGLVTSDGWCRVIGMPGFVRGTLRSLERRDLIAWPYLRGSDSLRDKPRLTDAGSAELARINIESAS